MEFKVRQGSSSSRVFTATNNGCSMCDGSHALYLCKRFLGLSIAARRDQVKRARVCWNCLRFGHMVSDCNLGGCRQCGKKHNSLLHERSQQGEGNTDATQPATNQRPAIQGTDNQGRDQQVISQGSNQNTQSTNTRLQAPVRSANNSQSFSSTVSEVLHKGKEEEGLGFTSQATWSNSQVLLSTAVVFVVDRFGNKVECRALLDSGSQSNFVTREFRDRIRLSTQPVDIQIRGVGQQLSTVNRMVDATILSRTNDFYFKASLLVINGISNNLPEFDLNTSQFRIPQRITLADPTFWKSGKVDMLLGAAVFWDLLCAGQVRLENSNLSLQKTRLGWIISGSVTSMMSSYLARSQVQVCNLSSNALLNNQLERFWSLEEHKTPQILSREDQACEDLFKSTTVRNKEGRFQVVLPMKEAVTDLGNSYDPALKRFYQLERRLVGNQPLHSQYQEFMQEYIDLGHMTRVVDDVASEYPVYYLPHHGVYKANSLTTRCRAVFDGSARTDLGISLNDVLMVGPKVQDNLFSILLRFRQYKVVISADIAKMYRQVLVHEGQRDLQRIFWRFSPEDPVGIYRLNTVTYGTSCAAYLAIRCLYELGQQHAMDNPEVSGVILKGFYVDDLLSGGETVEQVKMLKSELSKILGSAGFVLRKWVSNHAEVLVDEVVDNQGVEHYLLEGQETNTLGVLWNSQEDTFRFRINIDINQTRVTKRTILSIIAQIFDPMGLAGPVVVRAKLIIQLLWKFNLEWDEGVPLDIHTSWIRFRNKINELGGIRISRKVGCSDARHVELHCFTDASEAAYGAAIYVRSTDSRGCHHTHLLCAKSRVAPLKVISLPRLELCGALLGARLARDVLGALEMSFNGVWFWCDSTITLAWIQGTPSQWHTFVANRVTEIQEVTVNAGARWGHVESSDNPADVISRGIDPEKLGSCELWWKGPSWLAKDESFWPSSNVTLNQEVPESRVEKRVFTANISVDVINRFSSFTRLQRVVAYCLRFAKNCSVSAESRNKDALTVEELSGARNRLIGIVQKKEFHAEIQALTHFRSVASNSKLIALNPFIDDEGLVRVRGRLKNADISYNQRYPIILPTNCKLTELIVMHEHLRNLHAGPQALLAIIRLQYWPLAGHSLVSRVLRKCITCFRVKPVSHEYLMGNLPKERVTSGRPFSNVGVDFCGPFEVKIGKLRGQKFIKTYICVFICLATRAVHLEIVADLSTESFLNCFKRFIARRGLCNTIFSDNGTNFVGANNEIQELYSFFRNSANQSRVSDYFSGLQIHWKFIPPRSPHFGGIWEAAVRSAKYHLRRVAGNEKLRYDEFHTVIAQVESCLNSRPLTPLTNNPDDLNVLTPGHFLVGSALAALPQEDFRQENPNRITRFQHLTQIVQHFWERWSKEYLSNLQQRSKWRTSTQSLQPGHLVVIREDNLPPLKWQLGRVIEVCPGEDNVVRVALVKTSKGVFKRAASRLCVLPIDDQ